MGHLNDPAVIITGSNVCSYDRIVKHLEHNLDDPKKPSFFWDTTSMAPRAGPSWKAARRPKKPFNGRPDIQPMPI
jgi:hypothetical protein